MPLNGRPGTLCDKHPIQSAKEESGTVKDTQPERRGRWGNWVRWNLKPGFRCPLPPQVKEKERDCPRFPPPRARGEEKVHSRRQIQLEGVAAASQSTESRAAATTDVALAGTATTPESDRASTGRAVASVTWAHLPFLCASDE
jgi:hypothetical protein